VLELTAHFPGLFTLASLPQHANFSLSASTSNLELFLRLHYLMVRPSLYQSLLHSPSFSHPSATRIPRCCTDTLVYSPLVTDQVFLDELSMIGERVEDVD